MGTDAPARRRRRRAPTPALRAAAGPAAPGHWRAALRPFLATRALLFVFARWSLSAFPLRGAPWRVFPDSPLLDGWVRWDSGWYVTIAREGYRAAPNGGESTLGFFPLYPAASALAALPLRPLLPTDEALSLGALLVSNGCLLAALAGLRRLAARRLEPAAVDRALWLLCLFPFSFFLSAAYSESLFLALSVGAFVAADDERWTLAAALASLAVLTRIPGLIVCAALAAEYLRRRRWDPRRVGADAVPLALAPLSFGALALHHALRFGDALGMLHVRATGWHRPPGPRLLYDDLRALLAEGHSLHCAGASACAQDPAAAHLAVVALNLLAIPLGLWLSAGAARRFGAGLGVFALGSMAATLVNGIEGTGRVVATLFPAFLYLAAVTGRPALFRALCVAAVPPLLALTFYFSHWFLVI